MFDNPVEKIEQFEKEVKKKFVEEPGLMEHLIVVDKLLTGFDAPRNTVLYLARPLREHSLLQAIARVNRVFDDDDAPPKPFGYIIDYSGVLQDLGEALSANDALRGFDEADINQAVTSIADEARTFGMADLFRQIGIYSPIGQLYQPEDQAQLSYYKEAVEGQILEEGINEAGALAAWVAAATSYSTHGLAMLPMYIYYSIFGFQRVGDEIWAAADSRSRGFLFGATAGRTTLSGEGLQHQDGTSHLVASTIPNCRAYDPCFAYELAVILEDGMRRMLAAQEDVFYYVTLMNESYAQPSMPEGAAEGMRSRGIPMGQVELLPTRDRPTWQASPPTKYTCNRSSACASSKATPALRNAFSRCGVSGLMSEASALPSLVSGVSIHRAAKRVPRDLTAATMGVTRSASGNPESRSPVRSSWRGNTSRLNSR